MADNLRYISNDDTQNYSFYRLQSVVETKEHSTYWTNQSKFTKVPKVVEPTNKKTLLLNFGDQCSVIEKIGSAIVLIPESLVKKFGHYKQQWTWNQGSKVIRQ